MLSVEDSNPAHQDPECGQRGEQRDGGRQETREERHVGAMLVGTCRPV